MRQRHLIYREKSTSVTVRLQDASDAKLTVDDRSFYTFTALSNTFTPSRAVRPWFIQFVSMTSVLVFFLFTALPED